MSSTIKQYLHAEDITHKLVRNSQWTTYLLDIHNQKIMIETNKSQHNMHEISVQREYY